MHTCTRALTHHPSNTIKSSYTAFYLHTMSFPLLIGKSVVHWYYYMYHLM